MKNLVSRALFICLVASIWGCGGGQGTGRVRGNPMPPGTSWSGTYYTNWGDMELVQTGSGVVGKFGERGGHIEGTANGDVLVFRWSEEQRSSVASSKKRVDGSGIIKYKVVESGEDKVAEHRIEGTWGYGNERKGGGTWTGYKSKKDIKKEQRVQLITKGAAVKKTSPLAGEGGEEYIPPPLPENKKKTKYDLDDIPPPVVEE